MGTAFSAESKEGEVAPAIVVESSVKEQPAVTAVEPENSPAAAVATSESPKQGTESTDIVDASHPRSHDTSKEAFARVAAADDGEKGAILSAELASAEAKADINLAQFFEALESRCETGKYIDYLLIQLS